MRAWDFDEFVQEEEELAPLSIPEEFRALPWEKRRFTIRELWTSFLDGKLVLEPDFQRHYVWDTQRATRFVESVLLGLPTPPIFLGENPDGTLDVVDGHQRLQTIFRFMKPLLQGPSGDKWPSVSQQFVPLRLRGCEVLDELNGRDVTALSNQDRQRLWNYEIDVIHLGKDAHPDMKYVLFARLNQGAMALNAQEIRNCLYRGPYNKLIASLGEDPAFLRACGRNEPDKRMKTRELVLEFFALLHRRSELASPFRAFLNREMEANRYASPSQLAQFESEFRDALRWTTTIFGDKAFKSFLLGNRNDPNGRWSQRREYLIYDLEMVSFAECREGLASVWESLDDLGRNLFKAGLRRRLIDIMTAEGFRSTLREKTRSPQAVRYRFELWLGKLESAIRNANTIVEETHELLEKLRNSAICALCPQSIRDADDAEIVRPAPKLQAAHRFCATSH